VAAASLGGGRDRAVSDLTDRIVGTASTGLTMTDKDRREEPPIKN
jgi:hypothetical protein